MTHKMVTDKAIEQVRKSLTELWYREGFAETEQALCHLAMPLLRSQSSQSNCEHRRAGAILLGDYLFCRRQMGMPNRLALKTVLRPIPDPKPGEGGNTLY